MSAHPPNTAPSLSREELLELASLDALALLGDQDAALFDRAFLALSAMEQRHIREFQALVTTDPALMSADEPSDELRIRVLGHVAMEMRRSAEELAPVAMFGVHGPRGARPLRRRSTLRSPMLWQAASFALLACVVTTLVFYTKAVDEAARMVENIASVQVSDRIRESLGEKPWAVMRRAEFKRALNSPDSSSTGLLCVDSRSKLLVMVTYGLPSDVEQPELRITGKDGSQIVVPLRSGADGLITGFAQLDQVDGELLRTASISVVDRSGRELLG